MQAERSSVMTGKIERAAAEKAVEEVLKIVNKNPEDRRKPMLSIIDTMQKFSGDFFQQKTYDRLKNGIADPDNKWMKYFNRALDELNPNVIKMLALNLGYQAALKGTKMIRKNREKYQCNIPWTILIDPTSACNLHCTGCWAAEYGHQLNLSYEKLDDIITQGEKLGTFFYMYTGGEPLVRKNDLIKICEKHPNSYFNVFTNSTLIDEDFCKEVVRVGNMAFSISLEGFEDVNDGRRGKGDFEKVMHAMDLLKKYGIVFGTSICYTKANVETVTSDDFLDMIIEKGVRFSWYFHYMPVGNDSDVSLLPTAEQREYMYHRIREIRSGDGGKQIYVMDFQNDGEFVGGCIAGGRNYCHINANGDVEPCVFIHYSGANINEVSLLDALHQPLFMAYRAGQPFNENQLRPCPMLENPELLQKMVRDTGAKSTDLTSPESAEHLCGKCEQYAAVWKDKADEIWGCNAHYKQYYENYAKKNK